MGQDADRCFESIGLSRQFWKGTGQIREIFRQAFASAGFEYVNPHTIEKVIAQLGERICRCAEEWKSWSQNMGHEHEATTFASYGAVPEHRQLQIVKNLRTPSVPALSADAIQTIRAALDQAEALGPRWRKR